MEFHYVYLITNNITQQKYVGDRTSYVKPDEDKYFGSGIRLYEDVRKYKKENFSKIILETFDTRREAGERQGFYIKLYKTHISEGGYNIQPDGGICYGSRKHSIESRRKISEASKNQIQSEETKLKRSESHKGKKLSEETKEKIKAANKGKKHSAETIEKIKLHHKGMLGLHHKH